MIKVKIISWELISFDKAVFKVAAETLGFVFRFSMNWWHKDHGGSALHGCKTNWYKTVQGSPYFGQGRHRFDQWGGRPLQKKKTTPRIMSVFNTLSIGRCCLFVWIQKKKKRICVLNKYLASFITAYECRLTDCRKTIGRLHVAPRCPLDTDLRRTWRSPFWTMAYISYIVSWFFRSLLRFA